MSQAVQPLYLHILSLQDEELVPTSQVCEDAQLALSPGLPPLPASGTTPPGRTCRRCADTRAAPRPRRAPGPSSTRGTRRARCSEQAPLIQLHVLVIVAFLLLLQLGTRGVGHGKQIRVSGRADQEGQDQVGIRTRGGTRVGAGPGGGAEWVRPLTGGKGAHGRILGLGWGWAWGRQ